MSWAALLMSNLRICFVALVALLSVYSSGVTGAEFHYDQRLALESALADYDTQTERSDTSFQAKYEGFARWRHPTGQWPDWTLFLRPWLAYRSDDPLPFLNNDAETSAQVDGAYAELWEFVLTRHNVWGNPALSLSLGRQQFSGDYGFWWDDSLESLKLDLSDTRNKGFLAVASRQFLYNTDDNDPVPSQADIVYVLGEYHYNWVPYQWAGLRLLGQRDHSPANERGDDGDFAGATVGLQLEGERVHAGPINLDYHIQLAAVRGEFRNMNTLGFSDQRIDTRGWLAFTELGHSFQTSFVIDRLALRLALTDRPDTPFSGFFQSTVQSSRASRFSDYNLGLSGAFLNVRMTNLMLAGLMSQHALSHRSQMRLSVYDLRRRNSELAASQTIGLDYPESNGNHIGSIVEAQYIWAMFPYAINDEHLTFDVLATVSHFEGGNALQQGISDYQLSIDLNLRY
ncbi:hypothetical protein soil367_08810 [Hydrocarboniclastica marina]|uniref:Alginate export domain-containing protein n=2 Tax=Hydrocarboniclastica marina TaxID=2259620 RepID=A0A4P7XHR9_9ALTE|nr:hypothetical protein soil367_08810 [Hydrocarboniclastica marina]